MENASGCHVFWLHRCLAFHSSQGCICPCTKPHITDDVRIMSLKETRSFHCLFKCIDVPESAISCISYFRFLKQRLPGPFPHLRALLSLSFILPLVIFSIFILLFFLSCPKSNTFIYLFFFLAITIIYIYIYNFLEAIE